MPARTNRSRSRSPASGAAGTNTHPVAGQQSGADLEQRLGPRRRRPGKDADHAARILDAERAAPAAGQRGAAEPPVGERARAVVGELAQPRDRGQQLTEHRLGARAPGLARQQQRDVVELVERGAGGPPQVARAGGGGDVGPQRLRDGRACGGLPDGAGGRELHDPERFAGGRRTGFQRRGHREDATAAQAARRPRARSTSTRPMTAESPGAARRRRARPARPRRCRSRRCRRRSRPRRAARARRARGGGRDRRRAGAAAPGRSPRSSRRASSARTPSRSDGPASRRRTGGPPGTGNVRRRGEVSPRLIHRHCSASSWR